MDVASLIPHRSPFLFVDKVVELTADRAVTSVRADPEAAFFLGHYPGNPIMPGVLLCECAFQAGAALLARRRDDGKTAQGVPMLTRIRGAQFKRAVRPGTTLQVEVTLDEKVDTAYFMTGRVSAEGKLVLRVEFACTLVDPTGDLT